MIYSDLKAVWQSVSNINTRLKFYYIFQIFNVAHCTKYYKKHKKLHKAQKGQSIAQSIHVTIVCNITKKHRSFFNSWKTSTHCTVLHKAQKVQSIAQATKYPHNKLSSKSDKPCNELVITRYHCVPLQSPYAFPCVPRNFEVGERLWTEIRGGGTAFPCVPLHFNHWSSHIRLDFKREINTTTTVMN